MRALALLEIDQSLIPAPYMVPQAQYGSPSTPGVIPVYRAKSYP